MKRMIARNLTKANTKLAATIAPIVLVMIFVFFMLARSEILSLSKNELSFKSQNYADNIDAWAENVLSELEVYQRTAEKIGFDDEKTFELLTTSANVNDAYPYGLYWGDANGTYFDSSGWEPGEDFVVTERDWYIEGLQHDQLAFGEPYVDAMTGGTCVSATVRIDSTDAVSVLSADVYLDYASSLAEGITHQDIEYAFFVTNESRIIAADADASMAGKALDSEENSKLYRNINALLDEGQIGQSEVKSDNGVYFVDINKIENTNWYFVTCVSRAETLRDLRKIELIMLVVAVAACVALIVVTQRFSKEMRNIRRLASRDPLTGVLNRSSFEKEMVCKLAEHPDQGILFMLDLDNFKQVNDHLGHPEGDEVLKQFSKLIEGYFYEGVTARIGGDEFAVFMDKVVAKEELESILERFKTIFHEYLGEKYAEHKLSVSIGCAFSSDSEDFLALYHDADSALYNAKRNGKNRFHIA